MRQERGGVPAAYERRTRGPKACGRLVGDQAAACRDPSSADGAPSMSKRSRKRRYRKNNAANHGHKPNS
jgi:hypothetical protein